MKVRRWPYRVIVALLWSVPAALGCELASRGVQWWGDHHNPYITGAAFSGMDAASCIPLPAASSVVAGHEDALLGEAAVSAPASGTELTRLLDFDNMSAIVDVAERQRQYRAFLELDGVQRDLFARMHDAAVLEYSDGGGLLHVYGNNWIVMFARQMPVSSWMKHLGAQPAYVLQEAIGRGLREMTASGKSPYRVVSPPYDLMILSAPENGSSRHSRYVFVCPEYDTLLKERPPNSSWEIPFLKYRPGLRQANSGMDVPMDTNRYGFRSHDVAVPKPPGTFRILCIGGSTTEEGATTDTTFPGLMEKRLRALFPETGIEVVNCGVSGLETQSHLARLRDYLALEPDLLFVYEGVNDIRTYNVVAARLGGYVAPLSMTMRQSTETTLARHLFPPQAPISRLMFDECVEGIRPYGVFVRQLAGPLMLSIGPQSVFVSRVFGHRLFPSKASVLDCLKTVAFSNIERIHAIAEARGIGVVACSVLCPDYRHLSPMERQFFDFQIRKWRLSYCDIEAYCELVQLYNAGLRELCRTHHMPYLALDEAIKGSVTCFSDFCHMTREGIASKAQVIADYVGDYIRPALQSP